ncbi:ABC transporter permease [Staphylococcus caprae]|uniref:ABC transporter permease n=1 Tax=Staphylococcus caprae TaxID=29380 RepID=UPI000E6833C3|nr:ABC transporter permease [Staphylococcus caprae]MBU5271067.1 ABC transporter permease [Staphylococcus caprae]MDK6297292.1 ABC transporter permease [Staphylococcus caprae]MDK7232591.1 ABC transporter permease [Staphylococcus caprae]RIM34520.1 ABC transporter permease [Staphylococcus caprae]
MLNTFLKTEIKIMFRKKLYLFMSIFLPVAFYLLFTSLLDLPEEAKKPFYKEYMYSMTVFSLMNFCMMSFPLDMIEERNNGWYKHLMSTPLKPVHYYLAKVLKTMCQFLVAIIIIFMVAHFYKNVNMDFTNWILSSVVLWVGASLFLTFGLVIALFNDIQKASSVANLLNIAMAIVGGLWFPVKTFPDWLQVISKKMPTYHLKQIALDLGKDKGIKFTSFGFLIFYSIIFLSIALLINKKKDVS